jgi:GntR family transcriptional regulator
MKNAMILGNAQIPLYSQLADLFRQRILKGIWKEGDKLPSVAQLADEFGVARVTVRQAIEPLSREALVSPQRGRGTFVTGKIRENRWLKVETTLHNLAEVYRDTQPSILNIDESTRSPVLRDGEGIAAPAYVYMRRIHSHLDQPYCVIDIYLDREIFALDPERFRQETVIPIMLAIPKLRIATAHQVLTISTADFEVATHLQTQINAPVANVRRIFTGTKRRVIYLAEVTYRGDYIHMEFDLKS